MTNEVLIDEWTLVLLGDSSASAVTAQRLREVVDAELTAVVRRLTPALAPDARAEILRGQ